MISYGIIVRFSEEHSHRGELCYLQMFYALGKQLQTHVCSFCFVLCHCVFPNKKANQRQLFVSMSRSEHVSGKKERAASVFSPVGMLIETI